MGQALCTSEGGMPQIGYKSYVTKKVFYKIIKFQKLRIGECKSVAK